MLIGSVKLTKDADPDEYKYSGYSIGFDSRSEFILTDHSVGKNVIIFGVDMSSAVHIDNNRKGILVLGKEPTLHEQQKLYILLIFQDQKKDLY